MARPQRQAGALTADVLAVIRLTAVQPRQRGRGIETPAQAAVRARFDLALVAVLSDGGLRRSEASALTWCYVQRWDDGSGRITVIRSKTDTEAEGAVVAITPAAVQALDAIRPVGVTSGEKVFGLSESQIARRVKAVARAAGLADWENFSGHSGRVGMARRMAQNGDRRQLVLPAHCLNKTVTQRKRCIGGVVAGPHTPSGIGCRFFDESLTLSQHDSAIVTGAFSFTGRYVARHVLDQGERRDPDQPPEPTESF